jgi:proline iminopeptidase
MGLLITLGPIALAVAAGLGALVVLAYLLTGGQHAVAQTVAQDPSIPHVTLGGVTFHAETFGDPANPVVIAIHGGPGSDYRSILSLQALSDQFFVVFYDQRGTGLSPRVDPAEITLASSLADLDAIVDHYGGSRPVNLVGHSWGAMLASAYLGQHPEKVEHAVLAEPGFLTAEMGNEWVRATAMRWSPGLVYYIVRTKFECLHVRGPDDHAADDYFRYRMARWYLNGDGPMAGYYRPGHGPREDEAWRPGARANAGVVRQGVDARGQIIVNFVDGVERFTNKVLFIASEGTLIGAEWQKRHVGLFPNAELAVIPDAGHEMFLENPEASLAPVRAYLNAPAR